MQQRRTLMPVEVKQLGDRVLEIAGSTEDVDRMGDVIKADGWQLKSFRKNPVFMWGHDYSQPPIGRATRVWIDKETKRLMFRVEFADKETYEFADTIYKLYKGGFLHATSVGFIPLEWEGKSEDEPNPKWEGNVFTKQELLELSAVPVPANAEALVSAREQGLITVKELSVLTEQVKNTCECIDCGHQLKTEEHCRDLECSECGGDMRQIARPGPGQESVNKPEETDEYIRIPVKGEVGKHTDHKIRTIDIDKGKGIKALYCVDCKMVITYLFDKDEDWTMESAQEWVDEHAKALPEAKPVSQAQLIDELMYVGLLIEQVGLSDGAMPAALQLANTIQERVTGNDISVQIEAEEEPEPPDPAIAARERALEVAEVAQIVLRKLRGKRIY